MSEDDSMCTDIIVKRKIPPQNLILRIFQRENGLNRRGTDLCVSRQFYQNIFPNLTVINVEKPTTGFLRKFSPNGRLLIVFSFDQTSLEIYQFQGTPAAAALLQQWKQDIVPNDSTGLSYKIRSKIFDKLFRLKHTVSVSSLNKQLNRECSLFTVDGKYVIIGAALFLPVENWPSFYDVYTTNETISHSSKCTLEDYSIYLVDLYNGRVTCQVNFNADKIFLSHNQGIYLYNNSFAVLSVLQQTIHIYEIYNGKFMPLQKIGRFCCEMERNLYTATYPNSLHRAFKEATINSLKHRFLTFLFRKAKRKFDETRDCYDLRKFYQFFDQYKDLRMWKMQLLDESHILIKYASEKVVSLKVPEPNSHPAFFVFYNIPESRILAIYDNTSKDLLEIFENFCDTFRNAPCAPSNGIYARQLQQKCKQTIISARGGGIVEATKRFLAQIPISAQSYSSSPYLDLSLFSYDDKWISAMERPKTCGEYPIRFFGRDSGLLKFRIYPGLLDRTGPPSSRRLVAFTFHPTEPFAISVQRINNEYVVNFHIRNESTELFK